MSVTGGPRLSTIPPTFFNDYSFQFDGADDYVEAGDVWNLSTYTWSPFSLSFWIKASNPIVGAVHTKGLFGFDVVGNPIGFYDGYLGAVNVRLYLFAYGVYWTVGSNGTVDLFDNQWHHVMMILPSGSNDGVDTTNAQLYIDNTLITKGGSGVATPPAAYYKWQRLTMMFGNWGYLQGTIDEVALWKTDQTSNVETIYNNGVPNDITSLNPIVWYRMGDNGSYKSPQWLLPSNENKDKVSNYSMSLDGTNDYMSTSVSSLNSTTAFTISFWGKKTSTTKTVGLNDKVTDTNKFLLYWWSNGTIYLGARNGASNSSATFALSYDSDWHHFMGVYVGGTSLRLYVDGVLRDTITSSVPSSLSSIMGDNITIGYVDNTSYTTGNIDEVAIWNSDQSANISTISSNPLNDLTSLNPIVYYRMGENETFKSTQWLLPNNENKDKFSNYSMSFDGADDYYDVGNRPYIDSTSPFSVSCWVKVDDFSPNRYPTLIQLRSDTQYSWMMALSDHASYLGVWMGSVNGWSRIKTSTPASTFIGNWVHIVATYNGSGPTTQGNFTVYVNGLGTTLSSAGGFATTNQVNSFGAGVGPGTLNLLEGSLSDISVWDIELNSSQVTDIYNSGVPTDISAESGLVSYWKMGDDATYDNSLTQFTIPDIKQVLYSTKSFYFNGSSSYVTMGDVLDFEMTDTLSISCWMKKPVHGYDMLVTKAIGGGDYKGYLFWCRNSRIDFAIIADLSNYIDVYANVIFELDRWHHVAVTYDGSTNASGVKLYQDGVEVAIIIDVDTYTSGSVLNSHPFQIGTRNGGEFFDGNIDEVTVWDEVLTSGNITSIYNFNTPNDVTGLGISGLVGYWRMGEGATFSTNWTIPDDSANSNSGVSVNAVEADVKSLTPTSDAFSINMDIYDRVGDAPGSSGNTVSYNMDIYDRVGDAPSSENNALSYNMVLSGRTTDVPT